jgi:hypothetical protein
MALHTASPTRQVFSPSIRDELGNLSCEIRPVEIGGANHPRGCSTDYAANWRPLQWGIGFAKLAEHVPSDACVGDCVTETETAALLCG